MGNVQFKRFECWRITVAATGAERQTKYDQGSACQSTRNGIELHDHLLFGGMKQAKLAAKCDCDMTAGIERMK